MPYDLEVEMQIKEIVPDTDDTRNEYTRSEVVKSQCGYEERYRTCNSKCTAARNDDEIDIPVMHLATRTLKYKPARNKIVDRHGN